MPLTEGNLAQQEILFLETCYRYSITLDGYHSFLGSASYPVNIVDFINTTLF